MEGWELLKWPGLFLVGAAASFINMLAGGGSILALGLLTLMGLEPSVANATNRIGVLISTASGCAAYRSERLSAVRESLKLSLWTIPGAIAGAFFSVKISSELFERLIAVVMIFILITLFLPKRKTEDYEPLFGGKLMYPALLLIGFYGGFIQAGVGFLIMGALCHLGRMELMQMSMHRVFIVLIFTIPAVIVLVLHGQVYWSYAIVLSFGNAFGSWFTVKLAVRKGEHIVKIGLAIAILLMAIKFMFM